MEKFKSCKEQTGLFNRPGPRLVESLEILIEIIHDHKFNFNHEGSGWVKYF